MNMNIATPAELFWSILLMVPLRIIMGTDRTIFHPNFQHLKMSEMLVPPNPLLNAGWSYSHIFSAWPFRRDDRWPRWPMAIRSRNRKSWFPMAKLESMACEMAIYTCICVLYIYIYIYIYICIMYMCIVYIYIYLISIVYVYIYILYLLYMYIYIYLISIVYVYIYISYIYCICIYIYLISIVYVYIYLTSIVYVYLYIYISFIYCICIYIYISYIYCICIYIYILYLLYMYLYISYIYCICIYIYILYLLYMYIYIYLTSIVYVYIYISYIYCICMYNIYIYIYYIILYKVSQVSPIFRATDPPASAPARCASSRRVCWWRCCPRNARVGPGAAATSTWMWTLWRWWLDVGGVKLLEVNDG